MGKSADRDKRSRIEERGGYEPGPKTASELAPPPKNAGAGVKPSSASGGSDSSKK